MSNTKIKYQKIIKVGNSFAVTLDVDFVKRHNLKVGEAMAATYRTDQPGVSYVTSEKQQQISEEAMTETFRKSKLASSITPEFKEWVEKTLEEDQEAMEKLANL